MSCWIHGAGKLDQRTIAGVLDDAAAVLGDFGIDKRFAECLDPGNGALVVDAHQPAIPDDIRHEHSRQPSLYPLLDQTSTEHVSYPIIIKACGLAPGLGPMSIQGLCPFCIMCAVPTVRQVTSGLHESAGNFKPAIENHSAYA